MEKTGSRSIVGLGRLWEAAEMLRARNGVRWPVPEAVASMAAVSF